MGGPAEGGPGVRVRRGSGWEGEREVGVRRVREEGGVRGTITIPIAKNNVFSIITIIIFKRKK